MIVLHQLALSGFLFAIFFYALTLGCRKLDWEDTEDVMHILMCLCAICCGICLMLEIVFYIFPLPK